MYSNEPIDDYIRSILGYPNVNSNDNNMYYSQMSNMNTYNNLNNNPILEECYPEIYRIVYPMITKRCSTAQGNITPDLVEDMTNEIYQAVEANNNEINVNINLQNDVQNSNNRNEIKNVPKSNVKKEETKEENRENRNDKRNNNTLRDLIKILIIRELLGRPGRPNPRPPFPGGRPPIMPRYYNYMDIYER